MFFLAQFSKTQMFSSVVFYCDNGLHMFTMSYESGEAVHNCALFVCTSDRTAVF